MKKENRDIRRNRADADNEHKNDRYVSTLLDCFCK